MPEGRADEKGRIEALIGSRVGSCRLEAVLGRGAMGVVFRGVQEALDRPVAVKVLRFAPLNQETTDERFFREARAAARINHANVVHVYDAGRDGEIPFIVMEYVAGESLGRRLKREKRLSPAAAIHVGVGAARGLDAAHQRGLIHRDVKPDNILLAPDGTPKLVDFGLTKDLDDSGELTRDGHLLGTPNYMSPEACAGSEIDARSDLYSLGVVLFCCLAGQLPFTAKTTHGILVKHISEAPPRLRDIEPRVPAPLEAVVMKLLAKNPRDRLPSAMRVVEELILAGRACNLDGADGLEMPANPAPPVAPRALPPLVMTIPAVEHPPETPPAEPPSEPSEAGSDTDHDATRASDADVLRLGLILAEPPKPGSAPAGTSARIYADGSGTLAGSTGTSGARSGTGQPSAPGGSSATGGPSGGIGSSRSGTVDESAPGRGRGGSASVSAARSAPGFGSTTGMEPVSAIDTRDEIVAATPPLQEDGDSLMLDDPTQAASRPTVPSEGQASAAVASPAPPPLPRLTPEELILRAKLHYVRQDWEKAESDLVRAAEAAPTSIPAHFALACVLARKREDERALEHLELAVALGFNDRKKIEQSRDLSRLSNNPRFKVVLGRIEA